MPNSNSIVIKYGIIFRSFTKPKETIKETKENLIEVVSRAVESAKIASSIKIQGKKFFDKIIFLVPIDYDCGMTANAIRKVMNGNDAVVVLEAQGYHSREVLNFEFRHLDSLGITHAVIMSNKANTYLTVNTLIEINTSFYFGAKVVGVVLEELREIILEGMVQNTFTAWEIKAILNLDVPGFDSYFGVEEVAPSVRLIKKHGSCIAILDPTIRHDLDIRHRGDGKDYHKEVMKTKIQRQKAECDRMGVNTEFIKQGIMANYPRKV